MATPQRPDGRARPSVLLNKTREAAPARPSYAAPPATQTRVAKPTVAAPVVTPAQPAVQAAAAPVPQRSSGPRRAQLFLTRVDPWSVMKSAFMMSLAIAIVLLVSVSVLWWTLASAGVFDALTRTASDVAGNTGLNVGGIFAFDKVMGATLVLAAIEIFLVSALVTLFGFLYNLMVGITGGLELTLSEEG